MNNARAPALGAVVVGTRFQVREGGRNLRKTPRERASEERTHRPRGSCWREESEADTNAARSDSKKRRREHQEQQTTLDTDSERARAQAQDADRTSKKRKAKQQTMEQSTCWASVSRPALRCVRHAARWTPRPLIEAKNVCLN